MARSLLVALLAGVLFSGCAVHEAHKDHDLIRSTLLDLYTNQIMDNLVRAVNGLPIIQLDYTNAAAQVTITSTVGGSDNQATTASNVLAIPAATLAATRTIATTLAGNAGATNANQISIAAVPVTTSNDVYDAYLNYLDPQKNPGSLMVSCDPPPPGIAHQCKKFNGQYYWVPMEYRKLFFQLSLATTAQRGKALQAPDKFYTISVESQPVKGDSESSSGVKTYTYDVSKLKIPADTGKLFLDAEPNTEFKIQAYPPETPPGEPIPSMAKTLEVRIPADSVDLDLDEGGRKGLRVHKNLFYVSTDKAGMLHFIIIDADLKRTEYNEGDIKNHLDELKDKLRPLWAAANPKPREINELKRLIRSIFHIPYSKEALFTTPLKGKLFLDHNAPTLPNTEEALNRVNFQLQQIQFNQQRQLSP